MTNEQAAIANIFMPRMVRELTRARQNEVRFVHYTSADTGLKILRSEQMLLRNSVLMNDFSEVSHGLDCLSSAYKGPLGDRLKEALKKVQPDLPEILEGNFDEQVLDVRAETYLMSLSEHGSGDPLETAHEDRFGRLSMWRAYAPKNGVAFVLHNKPFVSESNAIQAFTSPVMYAERDSFLPSFEEVVVGIEKNIDLLAGLGGAFVHDTLIRVFKFAIQSTKHPSFKEEREWRVIYDPTRLQREGLMTDQQLQRIPTEVMSLGGVPQRVYAIPFKDYPEEGFSGATAPELIDRVLIGPTADSYAIAQAFVAELTAAHVENAADKVIITGVIGSNVRALREALGLSQEELAHRASVHVTYLSGVENGHRNPTALVIERLAAALKVDPVRLVAQLDLDK